MNSPTKSKPGRLHLLLTDDFLAAANDGAPFTAEGLKAACRVIKSPKHKKAATPISSAKDAKALLEEIWRAWLEDYKQRPDAAARHAEAERDIGEKLKGKVLREIIQNASDANSGEPFGGKALGLRTFLAVSDGPRIYSGHLSLRFDRRLAREALKQIDKGMTLANTPLMRMPFPTPKSKEPASIKRLIKTHDTVIILPFSNKKLRNRFLDEWDKLIDDVTVLLYLPALEHIVWERDDATETSKRTWLRDANRNAVRMVDEGIRTRPTRVRVRPAPGTVNRRKRTVGVTRRERSNRRSVKPA